MNKLFRSGFASRLVELSIGASLAALPAMLYAQESKPATPGATTAAPTVDSAWDSLLQGAIPQAKPDPALTAPQVGTTAKAPAADFQNHFFFETRSDYWRYDTSFTGNPTVTGIVNGSPSGVFMPGGYPYAPAFQPDANRIETLMDWGTRGWLSDRVNTHFTVRYGQDLSHVDIGSPAENIIETFGANRTVQFLTGSIEINSKPTDGAWAGTSLTVGRQYVYGAELASLDGAAFTIDKAHFDLTVFGGRRFSLFTDPDQRAIGGANFVYKLNPDTSIEYEGIWYIKGSNSLIFRHRLNPRWLISSYFRVYGGSPVDFTTQVLYNSPNSRTTLRAGFFQKLTNKDYIYDYTVAARDLDPYNPLLRLYLGPISQYSQFNIDARHTLSSRFRLGGALFVRRLNDFKHDSSPFDTSFEDYRLNSQVYPWRQIETFLEYHQRNSDRLSPLNPSSFDDLSGTGQTSVKDLTGELRRTFGEGRFSLNGGAYYRRISYQDRFYYLNGLHQSGWLAGAWWKVDQHSRLFVDYNLDNDFFLFTPDIKNSRALHVGVAWKY